jgi:hypothetical protein
MVPPAMVELSDGSLPGKGVLHFVQMPAVGRFSA